MEKVSICIGLNDRNTKKQEVTTTAAKDLIYKAVVKYFGFGTITECTGVYSHDDGTNAVIVETSINVSLTFFDDPKYMDKIKVFAADMKKQLNQETIYFDVQTVNAYLV